MIGLLATISAGLLNASPLLLADDVPNDRTFWFPPQYSNHAPTVDWPFYFITWVCIFFFVLIVVVMLWFMWRYSRARGIKPDHNATTHNTPLEITWSFIPLVLVIIMFYMGFAGYMDMEIAPKDSYQIDVEAKQWSWGFRYPNGWVDPNLHVWADEPFNLVMNSTDVLHALFIPDFRVKRDIVPGKFSSLWFIPQNRTGNIEEHHLFCAEYCGTDHSNMKAIVYVHPTRASYEEWLAKESDPYGRGLPPEAIGDMFYRARGCMGCHLINGTVFTGPPLDKTWGEVTGGQRTFVHGPPLDTGAPAFAENYILQSLHEPNFQVVEGFSVPSQMSTFKSQLNARDTASIAAFLKWMHDNPGFDPNRTPYIIWQEEQAAAEEENQ
jgi:cytochrome c oxidase subunit 2